MNHQYLSKANRLFAKLLLILMLAVPQLVAATAVDEPYNYSVTLSSTHELVIKCPVLNKEGTDSWIIDGNLYYKVEGSNTDIQLLHYYVGKDDNDVDDDDYWVWTHVKTKAPGQVYLTNGADYDEDLLEYDKEVRRKIYVANKSKTIFLKLRWVVPSEYRGKKLTFSWEVKRDRRAGDDFWIPGFEKFDITIPSGPPRFDVTVAQPMILPDSVGKLVVPWLVGADNVKNVKYVYNDINNKEVHVAIADSTKGSGMILLDPTVPHRSFYVNLDYVDSDGYLVKDVHSAPTNIPMIHAPLNFDVKPIYDERNTMVLSWKINAQSDPDLLDGDAFEIQRSVTGGDNDFVTIALEYLDLEQQEYEFRDSTILPSLTKEMINEWGDFPSVRYRIRRVVSQMWGWRDNPVAAFCYHPYMKMQLFTVKSAKIEKVEGKKDYSARVTWDYNKSEGIQYIWDERAEMNLRVLMYNRDGLLVDSIVRPLTMEEIHAKEAYLSFVRPCVNYRVEIVTSQGTSPFDVGIKTFIIKDDSDFRKLCDHFKSEDYNPETQSLYVRLETDLEPMSNDEYIFENRSDYPFVGIFDGNGHTIKTYSLLFKSLKNAHVCSLNLIYEPFDKPDDRAVLVQNAENTIFNNCRVDYKLRGLNSFAGYVFDAKDVTISNCLSYARELSYNRTCNFAGFIYSGRGNNVIENSLFAMSDYADEIFYAQARDFYYGGECEIRNCYYYLERKMDILLRGQGQRLSEKNMEECLESLGDEWTTSEYEPGIAPKKGDLGDYNPQYVYVPAEGDSFYFEASGRVSKKLVTTTRQSSVLLEWGIENDVVDYFEVLRREKGSKKQWDTLISGLNDMIYEDKTVSPLLDYEYTVRSAVDCEGTNYHYSDSVVGFCKHTGLVEGYVRFADGTGIPNAEVLISGPDGYNDMTVTDDKGKFTFDNLSYFNKNEVVYQVSVNKHGDMTLEQDVYDATFNHKSNHFVIDGFVVTKGGYRFSGYVMYEGTSIPVQGANFSIGDNDVYNAQGQLVESDFDGKFSFYVLGGQERVITVKKDGHGFGNGGHFTHTFNDHLAGIFFYDTTKVKLVGKVVGGDTQGNLPLGHSLSRNNLGNDLTMVLTLEGDNTSNLVFENTNPTLSERDTVYHHEAHDNLYDYQTKVKTFRKRMEVYPDPHTGEYLLKLPPVKWKVQQIYCEGYASLFQDGMVSDVIDLTNSTKEKQITYEGTWASLDSVAVTNPTLIYNAIYNRIYHAPVELTYKQLGYDTFDYFGDKSYTAHMLGGKDVVVPLAYQKKVLGNNGVDSVMVTDYTFKHPVFSLGRKYTYRLSAVERYFWNNNTKSDTVDVVKMKGGKVTIHNGMISSTHKEVVDLDMEGTGYTEIYAAQMMYNLSGENALRTVSMTLEVDSTTYEAKPLKGYVLNVYTISGASDVLNSSVPVLVDILRDPPGGGSSATLSKGSTLKYTYTMDMKWSAGVTMNFSTGTGLNNYYGVVVTPTISTIAPSYGIIQDAKTGFSYSNEIVFSGKGTRAFTYTMSATEDIKTSTSTTMTGADADVYIGVVQNNIVKKGVTVRAIPDDVFKQMVGRLPGGVLPNGKVDKDGTMIEFVEGHDAEGNIYHLIRDESLIIGPEVTSTFAHTQKYITSQLIPDLVEQCRALMFIGTPEEAQRQANATGKNVYLSLLQPDHKDFGMMNSEYYTLAMHQDASTKKDSMNYVIVLPNGVTDEAQTDEVEKYCGIMKEWIQMIITNEEAKLKADDLVRNFEVDGGTGMTYSENFESSYSNSFSTTWPLGISTDDYFGDGTDDPDDPEFLLKVGNMFGATFGKFIVNLLSKVMKDDDVKADWGHSEVEVNFTGSRFKFLVYPTMSYSVTPNNTTAQTYNRKESFSISMNNASHLNFDVYRAKNQIGGDEKQDDVMNVFTSDNFYSQVDYNEAFLQRHWDLGGDEPYRFSRGFVYRTRGGATARPWEDERKTVFYKKGTVLDARTKKIENPKIMLDKQSISGVPYGEAARFKIYLTNDSEEPNAITNGLSYFQLYQDETSNPNGARLVIDGAPLTGNFRPMYLQPGKVTEKTLEVYAGEDFDYENLTIGILSDGDPGIKDLVSFDVHYLREAGPVNISTPGDKWVMNTDAQFNEKRGYYLPVIIDGFDRKQKNFDHIEFQYKESARGDDFWTNLCSFYANDSLMALASGIKERMPENSFIETQFYGEGVVTEKAYDLRAVLYIRNGNSFITSSSKVLSGIKDTRRPRIFGTPSPTDDVLDIGDNVVFDFSEAIEHNYLDEKVNFEVKGEVNNDNFSEQVSLLFDGKKKNSLETEIERNFSGKDLTVSVMIKPDETNTSMPIFSHGTDNKKLQLWLTDSKQLKAVVNGNEYKSDAVLEFSSFRQVSMVIAQPENGNEPCRLMLYNGGNQVGNFEMKEPYTGIGRLIFGRTNEENRNDRRCKFYSGRMMEARVWYRALNGAQIGSTYGFKRLTGYEKGLVDYYPMNEGDGSYVTDKAQGAHAQIIGADWALPRGMSLHIDWEDRGIGLTPNAINRTADQDYTLMFWFRTNNTGHGALISNGAGYATDEGALSQFYIGFEGDTLRYRSNGMTVDIPGHYDDNKWHHYAMTVNRARNVANIYIDRTLHSTFAVDTLGGISGGYPLLGGTLHKTVGSSMVEDTHNWLSGNLDDICMFEQALPLTLIKNYSLKCPYGDESGLMFYLGFSHQELQSNNQYETVKYPYSQRIHKDANGNIVYQLDSLTQKPTSIPVRDYLFTDPVSTILSHIDETYAAPVKPAEELKQLNFSYVGRDNQLLINIDEPTEYINKRNVYVTIRDIPDLNGNNMASPVSINCFVDCNPLRWESKTLSFEAHYGNDYVADVLIKNVSGSSHTYEVTNNPKWLTISPRVNTIGAKDEAYLTFTINKNLNVGTYDEILYLTDENGLSEPLSLHVTVYGDEPEWTVDKSLRLFTMNIVGQVVMGNQRDNEIVTDNRDIVGVFDKMGVCHGVNHITYDEETGSSLVYLTVYNDSTALDQLYFKLWHYSTGKEMILDNYDNIKYVTSKLYGRRDAPCIFYADNKYVQTLDLEKGWNWVSFYVYSTSFTNLDRLLSSFPWQNGDIITDNTSGKTLVYANNHWALSESMDSVSILPRNFYAVKVKEDISVQVGGYIVKDEGSRTVYVYPEWNSIGYTPMVNLPLETALAGYFTNAKDGDIIKSHDEFSIFNESAGGGGRWEGSLQYMRPGEGYMLYSQVPKVVEFTYPFYEPNSSFVDVIFKAPEKPQHNPYPTTMSLTAVAEGLTLEPGDRLLAYSDGEMCGTATMTADSLFFVSIGGDKQRGLSFAIEREGDIIATTPEVMTYKANAVAGKPSLPTHINFAQRDIPRFGWYTLDGIRLQGKPAKKGVYIYNGKKRVVE